MCWCKNIIKQNVDKCKMAIKVKHGSEKEVICLEEIISGWSMWY